MFNRISGFFLIVVAVAVGVHTVVETLYHNFNNGELYGTIWGVLDWFMALALILGLYFAYNDKSGVDNEGDQAAVTREFVIANTLFYGFLFVSILFFWNWLVHLFPGWSPPDGKSWLVWLLVDAMLPLLAGGSGVRLLRSSGES